MTDLKGEALAVRSSIVHGEVRHWRAAPREHFFSYPMLTLQLDLDELEQGKLDSFLFKYDTWGVCGVRNRDYLVGAGALREKVELVLQNEGHSEKPDRITLVTMPRYFGYVFNPVSFFLCFDAANLLTACVTQVSNTFGEVHVYPLVGKRDRMPVEWRFPKNFFVSPFYDSEGEYTVEVAAEGERLSVRVDLTKDSHKTFSATLEGASRPLTKRSLFSSLLSFPCSLLLTMPRIHLQALVLFFSVKVTPFEKPEPRDPYTIRSKQNIIHRLRLRFLSALSSLRSGLIGPS